MITRTHLLTIILSTAAIFLIYGLTSTTHAFNAYAPLQKIGISIDILPSSPLYPIKLYWEDIKLFITAPDQEKRAEVLLSFCTERLRESYATLQSADNADINNNLLTTIKRYDAHISEVQRIINSVSVKSKQLESLWQEHKDNHDALKTLLKEKEDLIGFYWSYQISNVVDRSNQAIHTAQNPYVDVLGEHKAKGLELYELRVGNE